MPGIAIGVVQEDKPLWQKFVGVADAATKGTITSDTMFPAASLGKPVAAYVALRLAAAGKFDLDTPLKRYVPDHTPADPRGDKLTARHVLSHSTGLRELAELGRAARSFRILSPVPDFGTPARASTTCNASSKRSVVRRSRSWSRPSCSSL